MTSEMNTSLDLMSGSVSTGVFPVSTERTFANEYKPVKKGQDVPFYHTAVEASRNLPCPIQFLTSTHF